MRHGRNEIREQAQRGPWQIFGGQFTDFMILLLIAAAAISGAIGEPEDAAAILAIVILNAIIGFVQEYRAEQALRALRQLAARKSIVRRDGQLATVPATELVPGDVVLLEAGGVVPADLRLAEAIGLRVEEAALTGESQPVEKATLRAGRGRRAARRSRQHGLHRHDRHARPRRGHRRRDRHGHGARPDRDAARDDRRRRQTPLQRRLARFGRQLSRGGDRDLRDRLRCSASCAASRSLLMFLTAVSLAVAAVPEALPAVITIGLALGAQRLVGKNALIRRLPAVETLGSVTYICSDKTGTLTQNRMRVDAFFVDGEDHRAPPRVAARRAGAVGLAAVRAGAVQRRRRRPRERRAGRSHRGGAATSRRATPAIDKGALEAQLAAGRRAAVRLRPASA